MSGVWNKIRCKSSAHRWQEKRIDGEKVFECRDCHKRYFGDKAPIWEPGKDGAGAGGGNVGGSKRSRPADRARANRARLTGAGKLQLNAVVDADEYTLALDDGFVMTSRRSRAGARTRTPRLDA